MKIYPDSKAGCYAAKRAGRWRAGTVGTVNLDMRGLWLNFEITLRVIDDMGFGAGISGCGTGRLYFALRLLDAFVGKRPLWRRITERLFCFFGPLL